MTDVSCFHNLKTGGIERQLAPGVSARVFPGVHAMLSVVTLEPGAVSPVHAHPNEQWGVCLEGEWIRVQDGVEHHVKAGRLKVLGVSGAKRQAWRSRSMKSSGDLRCSITSSSKTTSNSSKGRLSTSRSRTRQWM